MIHNLLSSQLPAVTWDRGLSSVTVAIGKMNSLYSGEPVNLGTLGAGHPFLLDSPDLLMSYIKSCQIPVFIAGAVLR